MAPKGKNKKGRKDSDEIVEKDIDILKGDSIDLPLHKALAKAKAKAKPNSSVFAAALSGEDSR